MARLGPYGEHICTDRMEAGIEQLLPSALHVSLLNPQKS